MKMSKEEKKAKKQALKELNQAVDEEIKLEEEEKDKPFDVFTALFEKDPDEEEFDAYYKENYREAWEEEQKENKKMIITVSCIMVSVFLVVSIGLYIITEIFKPDLLKITKPLLTSYYQEKYAGEEKIDEIEYVQVYNEETRKMEDTNIVLATMTNNNHIMCIDNDNIGDDFNIEKVESDYNSFVSQNFVDANIILNNPHLSYSDYYVDYSIYYDYISVLPAGKSYQELIDAHDNKLTVTDVWIYQGVLNTWQIQDFLNNFNENSIVYAIKQEYGSPVNLTVITRNGVTEFPVDIGIALDDNITNYQIMSSATDTIDVQVARITTSSVDSDNDYKNGFSISYNKIRRGRDEISMPYIYLIKFNSSVLDSKDLTPLKSSGRRSHSFSEFEKDYPNVISIGFSDAIYVIGSDQVAIANKTTKQSFWCKLNLC